MNWTPPFRSLSAVNQPFTADKQSEAVSSSLYHTFTQKFQAHKIDSGSNLKEWKSFFGDSTAERATENYFESSEQKIPGLQRSWSVLEDFSPLQIHQSFIIAATTNGFILVDQQLAHQRVLYERYLEYARDGSALTQKSLFPISLPLAGADGALLEELIPDLSKLGYEIEPFGNNDFLIQGCPADIGGGNEKVILENILEQFKHFNTDLKISKREKLIRSVATQQAVKKGSNLGQAEMKNLLEGSI